MTKEEYISNLMYEDEYLEYYEALQMWHMYQQQLKEMEE